eukprot:6555006-Alexandrium_andersonii.AAC.1
MSVGKADTAAVATGAKASPPSTPLADDRGVPYRDCDGPVSPAGASGRSTAPVKTGTAPPVGRFKGTAGGSSDESE